MGLQFCRAVHMEQTLRFPSKRQHKRLSEAWHCFPGNAPGISGRQEGQHRFGRVACLGRVCGFGSFIKGLPCSSLCSMSNSKPAYTGVSLAFPQHC